MTNLLPSAEREYKDKIRQLQQEKEAIRRIVTGKQIGRAHV